MSSSRHLPLLIFILSVLGECDPAVAHEQGTPRAAHDKTSEEAKQDDQHPMERWALARASRHPTSQWRDRWPSIPYRAWSQIQANCTAPTLPRPTPDFACFFCVRRDARFSAQLHCCTHPTNHYYCSHRAEDVALLTGTFCRDVPSRTYAYF